MSLALVPPHMGYLLDDRTHAYLTLSTLMPDGAPQATVLWFDSDGEALRVNIRIQSVKARNLRRDPRWAAVIPDPRNANTYLLLRGAAIAWEKDGATEHLAGLGLKYEGAPYADPGHPHIILRLIPERVYVN